MLKLTVIKYFKIVQIGKYCMKAALLEVSHLHFPPYIKDLFDEGIKVSGFWAKSERIRAKYSKPFRCDGYNDWEETLGSCSYEIAFAFGEHD